MDQRTRREFPTVFAAVARRAYALAFVLAVGLASGVLAQETKPVTPAPVEPKAPTTRPSAPKEPAGTPGPVAPKPESTPEGQKLLQEVLRACDSEGRLANLQGFSWTSRDTRLVEGGMLEREVVGTLEFPTERFRMNIVQGANAFYYVVTEEAGWQWSPRGLQDFPQQLREEFRSSLATSTTPLLRAQKELIAKEMPMDVLAGKEYRVLRVWRGVDGPVDLYIDPDDLTINRRKSTVFQNGKMVVREEKLWDYRDVDGVKLPYARSLYDDGVNTATITTIEYRLDPEIPAGFFDRPKG